MGEDYSGSDELKVVDEILSINGESVERWLERTAQYISADTPYIANSILESTFPMYLWVETGERENFTLPNTGFKVGFPKAYIIRPSGDERLGGVQPDIVIRTPIVPSDRDVVLDELLGGLSPR